MSEEKKKAASDERNNVLTLRGGSIMLWGSVAASGTGNTTQVDGRDSTKYTYIKDVYLSVLLVYFF